MAQLNIYLQDELLKIISSIAKAKKKSVSAWVRERIEIIVANEWPPHYFEDLASIKDQVDIPLPVEIPFDAGSKQEDF